jgi:hypothetical protein
VRLFTKAQAAKQLCRPLRHEGRHQSLPGNVNKQYMSCSQNKVMLLWVHGHSGILENKYADDLSGRIQYTTLQSQTSNFIPACVDGLEVKKQLKERHNTGLLHLVRGSQSSLLKAVWPHCLWTYWPWTGNNVGW